MTAVLPQHLPFEESVAESWKGEDEVRVVQDKVLDDHPHSKDEVECSQDEEQVLPEVGHHIRFDGSCCVRPRGTGGRDGGGEGEGGRGAHY